MAPRDEEVEQLYQVPLTEFTAARNALARARGKVGADVRTLPKPTPAVWAVNQLFWKRRAAYDAVIAAGELRRAAHARVLSGKAGDVSAAEKAHQEAVRTAVAFARELLRDAGDAATAATIHAVTDTLHGLPGSEPPGRMSRPLKPLGLEALAGLVTRAAGSLGRARTVSSPPRVQAAATRAARVGAAQAAAAERCAEKARLREVAALEKALKAARGHEKRSEQTLKAARHALERAQRDHERLADQLQFALKQIQDRRDEIAREDQRRREAVTERERLEARLDALRC